MKQRVASYTTKVIAHKAQNWLPWQRLSAPLDPI